VLISLYLPSSTPELIFNERFLKGFLEGFVSACKTVGCVWISGETPQLKGKICEDKLDIAGALFALMPPGKRPVDGTALSAGNKIVLIESSGPHENGFTTLRKIASGLRNGYRTDIGDGMEFWQAINAPSILYTPLIQKALSENVNITNIENITGHGWQKLMRSSKPFLYRINKCLPMPQIFSFLEEERLATKEELFKTFNCGAGLAVFVPTITDAERLLAVSSSLGLSAVVAGEVEQSKERKVIIEPFEITLDDKSFQLRK